MNRLYLTAVSQKTHRLSDADSVGDSELIRLDRQRGGPGVFIIIVMFMSPPLPETREATGEAKQLTQKPRIVYQAWQEASKSVGVAPLLTQIINSSNARVLG